MNIIDYSTKEKLLYYVDDTHIVHQLFALNYYTIYVDDTNLQPFVQFFILND
jgi:hypothetical protein